MQTKFIVLVILIIEFNLVFKTKSEIFKDYEESKSNIKDQPQALKLTAAESTNASSAQTNSNSTDIPKDQKIITNLSNTANVDKKTISSNVNMNKNGTTGILNVTGSSNNTQIKDANNATLHNILRNVTMKYPELGNAINNTLKNIGLNDTSNVFTNSSIFEKFNRTDINKAVDVVKTEVSKAVLKHEAETALKDLNKALSNAPSNRTLPKKIDFNPSMWLSKLEAPWKHVSVNDQENSTEVIQACKFDVKVAICSAQFTKWKTKVWFEFAEAPSRNGINLTVFEHGHQSRVTFFNKVNGTDCQIFQNGTFHQICLKVYGYDQDLGPTRVCLEFGAALFNHGVASTDYGCFRFGFPVRHEEPFEGETPPLILLNSFILGNQYSNFRNTPTETLENSSNTSKASYILLITLGFLLFK